MINITRSIINENVKNNAGVPLCIYSGKRADTTPPPPDPTDPVDPPETGEIEPRMIKFTSLNGEENYSFSYQGNNVYSGWKFNDGINALKNHGLTVEIGNMNSYYQITNENPTEETKSLVITLTYGNTQGYFVVGESTTTHELTGKTFTISM